MYTTASSINQYNSKTKLWTSRPVPAPLVSAACTYVTTAPPSPSRNTPLQYDHLLLGTKKQIVDNNNMLQQRSWVVVAGSATATALLLFTAISHHVVPGVDGHAYLMKPHSRQYLMSRVFKEE